MKLKLLLPLLFLSLMAVAQENKATYQIQLTNPRVKPSIPGNIEELVEKHRDANKIIYFSLGTAVRVKVLPLSEIKKAGFAGVEKVKYLTQEEFKQSSN